MENKRIAKKSLLYFIGNFSSKMLSSLLVPIYAFYIASEELGIYDYSQTIMNIVIPIVFVSIWEAIIRFILGNKDGKSKEKEFASSAVFTIGACIVLAIGIIIVGRFIEIHYIQYFIMMCCATALAQIWQYYARVSEKNKLYVATSVISTIVNLSLNIVLILVLKWRIEALYISYICAQLVIFIILELKLKIRKFVKVQNIDLKLLKEMIIYSAPLVVNSIATWIFSGFGRIIIFENLGASSNGIYTFANKFVTIITTVGNVVTMAILEEAMISLRNNQLDSNYPKTLEQIFRLFLSLILVAMPAISIFYEFIGTTEYYQSLNLLPILLLYAVLVTMSTNFGIIFKTINKNKYQVITTIAGSIVMLLISYLFLKTAGVYAVAVGQALSALVMLLGRYFISKKFVKYSINWFPIIALMIGYGIISVITIKFSLIVNSIILLGTIGTVILINKEFLQEILKKRTN